MKDFILPDIGEGIVECELLEWLVNEGDQVIEDQPIAEVMTDKATVQIPAMHSGQIAKLYYQAGDIAKVHAPLFAMTAVEQNEQAANEATKSEAPTPQANSAHANSTPRQSILDDFILPDIGEGIVECELIKWLVNEGDSVVEDQTVVEVMTDKAMVEIPAKHPGVVSKLYYKEGETAKVHSPLYQLQREGQVEAKGINASSETTETDDNHAADAINTSAQGQSNQKIEVRIPSHAAAKVLASPAVRRVAREQSIDIQQVVGSGHKGRVLKQDVLAFASQGTAQSDTATTHISAPAEVNATSDLNADRIEPIKGMRAAMAKQMLHSVSTIPHFSVSDELQMDALIELRTTLKPSFEAKGQSLSFMPFLIKALSLTLLEFPILNSQVNADCNELTYKGEHNIGVAVDGKMGLVVPNIKSVQTLSLFEIAEKLNTLIAQAREGRLPSAELQGGTISLSNIGVIGATVATPIINAPESAIAAIGKMQKLPRFNEQGEVIAVNLVNISWSADHRIIDGATMVRANNQWKAYLENPSLMLTSMR